jgi:acyl-CoA thioester hydrolase
MDAAYREQTRNTLYTVEMHIHYLLEIKKSDIVLVNVRVLDADHKRLHAAFDITREGDTDIAATAEVMLLHVHQGETVTTARFPPEVADAIAAQLAATASAPKGALGSRQMELRPRK